jgi:hypothetical protein
MMPMLMPMIAAACIAGMIVVPLAILPPQLDDRIQYLRRGQAWRGGKRRVAARLILQLLLLVGRGSSLVLLLC